jgi:hypothetical protein
MEVKGTAVKSLKDFVENNYRNQYNNWIDSMPEPSKEIMKGAIFANNWYPMNDAVINPSKAVAKMFFSNDEKEAAFQMGRYSAEVGLKGVYKIFIMIAKPGYIMQRANRVFQSYYSPSNMEVFSSNDNEIITHITNFAEPSSIIEYRIAGWKQKALELTHCRNVKVVVTKSLTKGDNVTEFTMSWD